MANLAEYNKHQVEDCDLLVVDTSEELQFRNINLALSNSNNTPGGFPLLASLGALTQQQQQHSSNNNQHNHHHQQDPTEVTLARVQGDLQLLPELNGDLAMSLSPKHQVHTTPFSVTDILSPIEESYRKSAAAAAAAAAVGLDSSLQAPPSPYRSSTGGSSSGSAGGGGGGGGGGSSSNNGVSVQQQTSNTMSVPVTNPYMHVPQLSHHGATAAFPSQYCNGSDISAYGDMRNSAAAAAGWYGATANDPRFASEYMSTNNIFYFF